MRTVIVTKQFGYCNKIDKERKLIISVDNRSNLLSMAVKFKPSPDWFTGTNI